VKKGRPGERYLVRGKSEMNRISDRGRISRTVLTFLVSFGCIGCDQVTKSLAKQGLAKSGPISFLHDVFRLQYAENSGGFLSLGADSPEALRHWVFVFVVGVLLAGLLIFLITSKKTSSAQSIALSLLLGGGVANLIDRVCNEGRVIDFMNMGIGSFRTGVFNVADIAISVGGIWLLTDSIKRSDKRVD
jgi:signal peptidase II